MVMSKLATTFGEDPTPYEDLATQVSKSYVQKFWNEEKLCLYDVVDVKDDRLEPNGINNDQIRPNQIFAVSLPYTMLPEDMAYAVVQTVHDLLYVDCGLRSLSTDDEEYHGIYCGALEKRDPAYHQGTAWGFLLGPFLTAYCKTHKHSKLSAKRARKWMEASVHHMHHTGCIGSISEIFDGDAPHNPRGCYAQAWSVGELLRAYTEDILEA
jgi:glycogen debranching enzyme